MGIAHCLNLFLRNLTPLRIETVDCGGTSTLCLRVIINMFSAAMNASTHTIRSGAADSLKFCLNYELNELL